MQKLTVNLGADSYFVYVGPEALAETLPGLTAGYDKIFWLLDKKVYHQRRAKIDKIIAGNVNHALFEIPSGESSKNLALATDIYQFLVQENISRASLIVGLGGGVVGDLAGFIAATILRGVALIMVPTTLLAQVDSSIGGKNGVNLPLAKNMVGTFYQPLASINDNTFLSSLDDRELISGFAELLKHSLIADRQLFDQLSAHPPLELLKNSSLCQDAIYKSCLIKAKVVSSDEKEQGLRAILNFGHTIAHFIETLGDYQTYKHGECVLGGMDFAAFFSWRKGLLMQADYLKIQNYIKRFFKPLSLKAGARTKFLELIARDKKVSFNKIRFIALKSIGQAIILENTELEELEKLFFDYLQEPAGLIKISH